MPKEEGRPQNPVNTARTGKKIRAMLDASLIHNESDGRYPPDMTKQLLAIDHDQDFADFVGAVARDIGFSAEVTTDTRQFRQLYEQMLPDVVALEFVMPDVDGFEHLRWLANRQCRAQVLVWCRIAPRIAECAGAMAAHQGLRPVWLLEKPIHVAKLRALLASHLMKTGRQTRRRRRHR